MQPLQELAPPIGVDTPSSPLEKETKADMTRSASSWQRGHLTGSLSEPVRCNSSNLLLQTLQQYSYRGISVPNLLLVRLHVNFTPFFDPATKPSCPHRSPAHAIRPPAQALPISHSAPDTLARSQNSDTLQCIQAIRR